VTWRAFKDHGSVARTVDRHLEDAHRLVRELNHAGIELERVGAALQAEGVDRFIAAYDRLLEIVEAKRVRLLAGEGS
jgi:hypothetical protein